MIRKRTGKRFLCVFPHREFDKEYVNMAQRKVYVNVTTRLILLVDEGKDVNEIMENMDYDFTVSESDANEAQIDDTDITDWEITDSK